MARALKVVVPGAWYHVTAQGNRRAALFLNDQDRRRFVGLVSELPERFQIQVHACVLTDNHYHPVVQTPRENLRHAIRWLNEWDLQRAVRLGAPAIGTCLPGPLQGAGDRG